MSESNVTRIYLLRHAEAAEKALGDTDFDRPLTHPEGDVAFTVDALVAMYDWHGRHHTAHVTELRKREGW